MDQKKSPAIAAGLLVMAESSAMIGG